MKRFRIRRLVLLGVVLLLLATGAPGSAAPSKPKRGDGVLPHASLLPWTAPWVPSLKVIR